MSEQTPPKTGGLWARLFTMDAADKENGSEALTQSTALVPLVLPTAASQAAEHEQDHALEPAAPAATEAPPPFSLDESPPAPAVFPAAKPTDAVQLCQSCGAKRKPKIDYCDDCGWMFPSAGAPTTFAGAASPAAAFSSSSPRADIMPNAATIRIKTRYEVRDLISERQGVCCYRGLDHGRAGGQPAPVVIFWSGTPEAVDESLDDLPLATVEDDEILPGFDEPMAIAQPIEGARVGAGAAGAAGAAWPSLAWERELLAKANHPSLAIVVDSFIENNYEYLVVDLPQGRSLWDAWDDPDTDANTRYGWLLQIAEGMQALHNAGGILEGLRPDLIVVTPSGQAMIADFSDLLPLPLPPSPPIRATLYTAPELILTPEAADGRATLYSFGATLYSLEYLHHPLEEKDFEYQFTPRQITDRFPDVHPLFFRLINKTFVRDPNMRFPTDEAQKTDPSGMSEFIRVLETCRRNLDNARLDIAAWTTTGMIRSGNEDTFAVLHGVEARQDDIWEYALVLLCDGMGGYEAGEVAASLAVYEMRKFLLGQPMFASLVGKEPPAGPINAKAYQDVLLAALKHANKEVHTAARTPGKGRRGMGCTAECVYIDARNLIVGHVGDSRTYHLRQGRLVQLTRDQTLVNRLVELGQLTPVEAESHPRKNELQQAIGGQPDVAPNLYSAKLKRGDWVLVCSDGLTNHIPSADLEKMLTREAAYSAEEAARRLLNLVNLRGATDNATIVVIRAN